jgi:hypothetical protein
MQGMRIASGTDPSRGVRNRAPDPPHQRWSEDEAVRLVKAAWRYGYRGLACIIATAWNMQFSPVDVRRLQERHRVFVDGRLVFDRQADGRTKTGRAAIGTVSRRTERLVTAYLAGTERLPDAILFRMRTGSPYREATLAHDFTGVREAGIPRRQPQADEHAPVGCGRGDSGRHRCGRLVGQTGKLDPSRTLATRRMRRLKSRRFVRPTWLAKGPAQDARNEQKGGKSLNSAPRQSLNFVANHR